jgi:hypothetical protein
MGTQALLLLSKELYRSWPLVGLPISGGFLSPLGAGYNGPLALVRTHHPPSISIRSWCLHPPAGCTVSELPRVLATPQIIQRS